MAKYPHSSLSEELIRAKAHLIYVQGLEKGETKSPDENWQIAIDELIIEKALGTQTIASRIGYFMTWPIRKPWNFLKKETNREIIKIIVSLLGLGATVAAAAGLYLNYQYSQKQLSISESRQITDRFAKALELLKDSEATVRTGALFALERVAKDSPDDHETIMELFSNYIIVEKSIYEERGVSSSFVSTDVQAAITIIGRRNRRYDSSTYAFNLFKISLAGAKIINANLSDFNLFGTNLEQAILVNTNLSNANLVYSKLSGTEIINVNFTGADLANANLEKATLLGGNFSGADLRYANLNDININGTAHITLKVAYNDIDPDDSKPSNFSDADLSGADLRNAYLEGADFSRANLSKANLEGAFLKGANLEGVNLSNQKTINILNLYRGDAGANLKGTNLKGVNLKGAILFSTNLSEADLSETNLSEANLCKTILPRYLKLDPNRDCNKLLFTEEE